MQFNLDLAMILTLKIPLLYNKATGWRRDLGTWFFHLSWSSSFLSLAWIHCVCLNSNEGDWVDPALKGETGSQRRWKHILHWTQDNHTPNSGMSKWLKLAVTSYCTLSLLLSMHKWDSERCCRHRDRRNATTSLVGTSEPRVKALCPCVSNHQLTFPIRALWAVLK